MAIPGRCPPRRDDALAAPVLKIGGGATTETEPTSDHQTRLLRLNAVVRRRDGILARSDLHRDQLAVFGEASSWARTTLLGHPPGYRVTFTGADRPRLRAGRGSRLGYGVAWLYNRLVDLRLGAGGERR
jgi:hypothetical protein